ncbi:MAG TPA: DNA gyrase subunit A [Gemmatales bacterium]|nr:DNA gyrase subunit A [Gemmatales bacterium]
MPERIDTVAITDETRRRYLNYALSVITNRALPDVRDGLKPVQRRILYAMFHDLHLYANDRPLKCAKVSGEVMGNYHPHGDMAIYDALVRMTQSWVLRYPLIHGEGNFGSVEGYEAAASRYTECKLQPIAEELMSELRQKTVDMRANYDGNREEPTVLPARFPHILVNGSTGIAVGMATNIPPHNLKDVVAACIELIENPDATTAILLDKLKGPDFPLGGKVLADRKTLRNIYEEGQGSVKLQAEWKLEETAKKRQIIVTSIPYGVNKGNLEEKIGEHIVNRSLPQLLNVVNESNDKDGLRIALEIKPDADPEMVMAYLFKHTDLQTSFAYNMTCLVPSSPQIEQKSKRKKAKEEPESEESEGLSMRPARASLPEILRHFLDFRFVTVKRRYEYLLEQLLARIHILEAFRKVFNALDKVLELIKTSQGKADAAVKLMDFLNLDEIQADAILEMLLYKIARLEIKKILEELKEKKEEAERIEALLKSEKRLWGVVKTELDEVSEKHGERRRTRIVGEEEMPEFDPEAYIVRENTNVVLTRDGWIKRVGRLATVEGTRVREGDSVIAVVPGSTHDHVAFFSDDGVAYSMRMNEVPASAGYGEPIAKFFRLGEGARIIAAYTADPRFVPQETKPASKGDPHGPYLLAATAEGQVLRTPFLPFREASTVKGRMYARLNDKDKVVLVGVPSTEYKSLILCSQEGRVIHFPISDIPVLSGVGKGVMGIKLDDKDVVLGGAMIRNQNDVLTVETSGGKTMEFYGSREQVSRAGKGFEAVKRTSFTKVVPQTIMLINWEEYEVPGSEKNGKHAEKNGKHKGGGLFD